MLLITTIAISTVIVKVNPGMALIIALGFLILILAFLKTEFALYVLILSMLLSPEIPVLQAGRRSVVIRIDDLILIIVTISWLMRTAILKDMGLIIKTPLNKPIFYYFMACVIATSLGTLFGRVTGVTGFFYVAKYLEFFLVFFLTVNNLKNTDQIKRFVFFLILTACIVAITAVVQIPSGARVSAPFEGEHGEPNTLGGYLVLMISLLSGLIIFERKLRIKLIYIFLIILFIIP
ncbi:MAG: hypothetical protein ABIA04_10430, partial [Pseudomonadota bacterium]